MASIMELLSSQISGQGLSQLSGALGTDDGQTQRAVAAALPLILGALSKNAAKPEGAQALHAAIERDHDGSILDRLGDVVDTSTQQSGAKILGHAFGGKQSAMEAGVARTAGVTTAQAASLMASLAPVVMGAIGKQQRDSGLDASQLTSLLSDERGQIDKTPGAGGLLTRLLDQDGDDSIVDDLGQAGMGLLGKMFKTDN